MSYIVTGGAGFVGSNMVKKLNENGINDVIIVDNYDETKMQNLLGLQFTDYIDYSDGLDTVCNALERIGHAEGVFHIGAIYASSSAVYGNKEKQDGGLDHLMPHNIYAWSKWLFDKYVDANINQAEDRKVIGFRFFNVFGWGEFHKGKNANIVYRFYRMMRENGFIDLFKDHIQRDHVYVDDVAEVMYRAMITDNFQNGIYNLGGNHPISHRRVAEIVIETIMEEGLIEEKAPAEYIKLIDIPAELRDKFQFYTFAEGQMESVSVITKGNEEKMKDYVRMLIRYNK